MITESEVAEIVMEAVGPEIPIQAPFLKRRHESEDGILIVSLPREENNELMMRSLNRAAAAVYLLCDGKRCIREIADALCGLIEAEDEQYVALEAVRIIRRLQTEGLLRRPGTTPGLTAHGTLV